MCVNHTEASPAAEPRARGHCQAAGMEFSLLRGTSPFSHTGMWLFLLSPHLVPASWRWRWLGVLREEAPCPGPWLTPCVQLSPGDGSWEHGWAQDRVGASPRKPDLQEPGRNHTFTSLARWGLHCCPLHSPEHPKGGPCTPAHCTPPDPALSLGRHRCSSPAPPAATPPSCRPRSSYTASLQASGTPPKHSPPAPPRSTAYLRGLRPAAGAPLAPTRGL